ncbi:MAG: hypothetical protein R2854_25290 [Caldilineaceae bacterium]
MNWPKRRRHDHGHQSVLGAVGQLSRLLHAGRFRPLVETGFTRAKNVAHTMMMNMMVFCIGAIGYWLTGFALQFGGVNVTWPATATAGTWAHSPVTLGDWADCLTDRCSRSGNGACWAAVASCWPDSV